MDLTDKHELLKVFEGIHAKYGGEYQKGSLYEVSKLVFHAYEKNFLITEDIIDRESRQLQQLTNIGFVVYAGILICVPCRNDFSFWITPKGGYVPKSKCLFNQADLDKKLFVNANNGMKLTRLLSDDAFIAQVKLLSEGMNYLNVVEGRLNYSARIFSDDLLKALAELAGRIETI